MKLVTKAKKNGKAKVKKNGGLRGRPTFFRGKVALKGKNTAPPTTILYSKQGLSILDETTKRLTKEYKTASKNPKARISRNVVSEALTRIYGPSLTLKQIQRADA